MPGFRVWALEFRVLGFLSPSKNAYIQLGQALSKSHLHSDSAAVSKDHFSVSALSLSLYWMSFLGFGL